MSESLHKPATKKGFSLSAILNAGLIGVAGTVLVGIGINLLQYAPSGNYGNGFNSYDFFYEVSEWRLTYGHFLVVLFSVFYLFGHWHVLLVLHSGNKLLARAFFFSALFGHIMGTIWVSSRLMIGIIIKNGNIPETKNLTDYLISIYQGHYETLLTFLLLIYLLNSILFILTILKGETLYPKWMVFLNPAFLILCFYLLYLFIPAIGKHILPSIINAAHFLLFSTSSWIIYQHRRKEKLEGGAA